MSARLLCPSTLLLLLAGASAQNYRYSPSASTANSASSTPWSSSWQRYMQIHSDTRGVTMVIRELAFRRGVTPSPTTMLARSLDCELFMGDADLATSTLTFASNYVSPPWNVLLRKTVNLPDISAPTYPTEPFRIQLPFDIPFISVGVRDLAWEVVHHSNSSATTYLVEAFQNLRMGTLRAYGGACGIGGALPLGHSLSLTSIPGPTPMLAYGSNFWNGPSNVPALIMLGASPAAIAVPGLCASLAVGNPAITLAGTTDAAGRMFGISGAIPWTPGLAGAHLYQQCAVLDVTSAFPITWAMTFGVDVTVADLPSVPVVRRLWGAPFATTGSTDLIGTAECPGQLVTRFMY